MTKERNDAAIADADRYGRVQRRDAPAMRHILQTRTTIPPPSSYLTYAGKAGALLSDLVEHLRYHTSLTHAETEIAVCTAVRAANLDYIWDAHVKLGVQAGVREEVIHAIDTLGPLHGLTEDAAADLRDI